MIEVIPYIKNFKSTQILCLVLLLFGFNLKLSAQQQPQYTQYMYNTMSINPAYAGSRGMLSAFALHRNQWVGMSNAPVTNNFAIHTPLKESKLGLGLSVVNDRIGPIDENLISVDLSYSLQLNQDYQLSMGVKTTAQLFSLSPGRLNPEIPADPLLQPVNSEFSANLGAGLYLHSEKAYIGLSVPMFFDRQLLSNDESLAVRPERMTFYAIGGYVFELSPALDFKPAIMTKIQEGAPIQVDVSANFRLFDEFVLGTAYRWSAAFSALAGWQINDRFFVGYAYDIETTPLKKYNSGSHELFIRFELLNKEGKIISPRFF